MSEGVRTLDGKLIKYSDLRLGEVVTWKSQDEWFIVTKEATSWPTLTCVVSENEDRIGVEYGPSSSLVVVGEKDVPNKVWVALALWRLTQ